MSRTPTPETALFGIGLDKWPSKTYVLFTHVLIATRRARANAWNSEYTPSLHTVINFLNTYATSEKMFAQIQDKISLFQVNWAL